MTLDRGDYTDTMPVYERFGVRALIRRDGRYSVQQSGAGDYKIPGGGMERGEDHYLALLREVREETGLTIIRGSMRPIGEVLELRRDIFDPDVKFIAHTYYYFCSAEAEEVPLQMTASEIAAGFHPVWRDADTIIAENERLQTCFWQHRDTKVLRQLREKGML